MPHWEESSSKSQIMSYSSKVWTWDWLRRFMFCSSLRAILLRMKSPHSARCSNLIYWLSFLMFFWMNFLVYSLQCEIFNNKLIFTLMLVTTIGWHHNNMKNCIVKLLVEGYIQRHTSLYSYLFFLFLRKIGLGECALTARPSTKLLFGIAFLFRNWMTCLDNLSGASISSKDWLEEWLSRDEH